MQRNTLELKNVHKTYTQGSTQITVLKGISATFCQGHSYAITGASGSGKSTLLHLLAGLDTPDAGLVLYNNQNIAALSADAKSLFLNKSIGLLFQYPYLIKELTVLENVMIKGLIAHNDQQEVEQSARYLLEQCQLSSKISAYPGQLSGGQQQRVALARALMNRPEFLLADEPTGNLDEQTARTVLELMLRVSQEWKIGLVISSHDSAVWQNMATIFELKDGLLIKLN